MKSKFSLLLACSALALFLAGCSEKIKTDDQEENQNKPEIVEPEVDKSEIHLTQRELRGVWLTTVWNLDWPSSSAQGDPDAQKYQLQKYLKTFEELNINAVFLQVRPTADAFYESQYEPWCRFLTGSPNKAAGWDPIQYAIEEGHKRGIQIHAWMNPYRIATRQGPSYNFPNLDSRIPKEWVKDYDGIRMYNPGLPEVRQRLADIVKELLTKYPKIDGIHFDDYFYPDPSACSDLDDQKEYDKYHKDGQSIKEWRFDNVNQMVQLIKKTIKDINPAIAFTISPAGNMGNNMGYLYADIATWCKNEWVDAIIPQLYWGRTYFDPRLDEFVGLSEKVPIYVGYNTQELSHYFTEEYNYASQYSKVKGSVHYRGQILMSNAGVKKIVKNAYSKPKIAPSLANTDDKPAAPTNLSIRFGKLSWEGESCRYGIYKDDAKSSEEIGKSATLIGITKDKTFKLSEKGLYYVTAIDERCVESEVSDMIEL